MSSVKQASVFQLINLVQMCVLLPLSDRHTVGFPCLLFLDSDKQLSQELFCLF